MVEDVCVPDCVAVPVEATVAVDAGLRVRDTAAVPLGVLVTDDVREGVAVPLVAVGVRVAVGEGVLEAVCVPLAVSVATGEALDEGGRLALAVTLGVGALVREGVPVGMGVPVALGTQAPAASA